MSSTMPRGGLRPCTRSIHWPDRSARAAKFLGAVSHCVSKRPIRLGEAALLCAALPPTIQRIAGSWRRRSASFTSSYPARRPNTDCRNNPANACRPFLPLRASARTSPRYLGQTEYIVEFAMGEQPSIGGHYGTAKVEHQAAVKIEPNSIRFRFTRRVRHHRLAQSRISCSLLYLNRANHAETQYIIRLNAGVAF